jgi:hypothetical protein
MRERIAPVGPPRLDIDQDGRAANGDNVEVKGGGFLHARELNALVSQAKLNAQELLI